LNEAANRDFRGVFNDINLGDSRLGASTVERARTLNRIVRLVDSIDYKDDSGRDILGSIYEYLIGQFAASAGKKGGEFYTPHEVSKILAKIVTDG
jgi:type I restriction enzyme M protein